MKNLIIYGILLFNVFIINQLNPEKGDYIKIMHYGVSTSKYIPPLIISKQKLDIQLSKNEKDFLMQMQASQPITRDQYIGMLYDIIVTDSLTYSIATNFIKSTTDYYTNDVNENPPNSSENFAIIVDGKRYNLYWKYKYEFLTKLSEYLTLKNCDQKVAKKIANYK